MYQYLSGVGLELTTYKQLLDDGAASLEELCARNPLDARRGMAQSNTKPHADAEEDCIGMKYISTSPALGSS